MKQSILFLWSLLLTLSSCYTSPQDRAEAFIEEMMTQELDDLCIYQPLETVIDSTFYSILFDKDVRQKLKELMRWQSEYEISDMECSEVECDIQEMEDQYALNEPDNSNSILKSRYLHLSKAEKQYIQQTLTEQRAKLDSLNQKKSNTEKEIEACEEYIRDKDKKAPDHTFCGWQIVHKYNLIQPNGQVFPGAAFIILDEDMENMILDEILTVGNEGISELIYTLETVLETNGTAPKK